MVDFESGNQDNEKIEGSLNAHKSLHFLLLIFSFCFVQFLISEGKVEIHES